MTFTTNNAISTEPHGNNVLFKWPGNNVLFTTPRNFQATLTSNATTSILYVFEKRHKQVFQFLTRNWIVLSYEIFELHVRYHSNYVGLLCITTVFLQHDFAVSPRIGEIGEIHVKTNGFLAHHHSMFLS